MPKSKPPPVEPPPPYSLHGVDVPGRTLSSTTLTAVMISFHPDDAAEAARLAGLVQEKAGGRTVTYEIR